jgi:hypothetical protein
MTDDALQRIDMLIQVGLRLARTASSGRVLLAKVAETIDGGWLASPWGDEIAADLTAARAGACEPVAIKQIERALRDAWGRAPTDQLDDLDREPVATTPLAQVHRGVLDGAPVAVKVLRPGLAAAVRQDLSLLDGLRRPLRTAFPALDAAATLHEFRERVLEELDLESEASVQRRFHRALRRHPFLTVPAPHTELCHPEVIVSEWIDGVTIAGADPGDRDTAAAQLVTFVLGSARTGTMYVGPALEDVRVLAGGRLAILGFGASRQVQPGRVDAAVAALPGFADGDPAVLAAAMDQLGWMGASDAATLLELWRHGLADLGGADPVALDSDAIVAARDRVLERPELVGALIAGGTIPAADLWPMLAVARLFATIARTGATGAWRELAGTAVSGGWDSAR